MDDISRIVGMSGRFVRDRRGTSTAEYALLIFAILLVIAGGFRALGQRSTETTRVATRLLEGGDGSHSAGAVETSAGAGEAGQGHDEQPGDGQDTSGGSSKKLLVYAPKTYESRKDGGLINVIADVALDAATEVPGIGAIIDYVMEPDDKSASIKMQAGDAIREKLHGHAQDTSGDNPQRPLIYTPQKYESNQEGGLINTIEDIAIDGITEVPGASSIINYFSGDDDKSASVTMRAGDAIRDKMRGEGSSPPTSPDGKSSPR